MSFVFVDCEAWGQCPYDGELTEFGAVLYPNKHTFHGVLAVTTPDPANPAQPLRVAVSQATRENVFREFADWLKREVADRPIFVSDNPAYDFQWINDGFVRTIGKNPFGHSARRISDFYAGLMGDFGNTQKWKRLRVTPHTHNPVDDAMGNVEAFERLLRGER
jgi:hypothetical protein